MTEQQEAGMEITETNQEERMPLRSKAEAPGLAVLDPPRQYRHPAGPHRTRQLSSTRLTSEQDLDEPGSPRVRISMSVADARALADLLSAEILAGDKQRLLDQLWLRTALIEQRRRIRRNERTDFQTRADSILAALDP